MARGPNKRRANARQGGEDYARARARPGEAVVRWFGRWGTGMASQTSIRKALGAIKDSTKVGLATINSTNKVRIQGLDWIFFLSVSLALRRAVGWVGLG